MITLRRAEQREHVVRRKGESWLTFSPQNHSDPLANGFGPLGAFEERRLIPNASRRQPSLQEAEIITYVRHGTLAYEDSAGRSGLLSASEFQRMTAGPNVRYSETNTSPTSYVHVFQIWLRPSVVGLGPGHEQKRFTAAQRRGIMCVVASPDGQQGSLRLHQDALLYSAMLDRGQHVIHELSEERCAWLHIVEGTVLFGAITLNTGDGAAIKAERAVSMTASEDSEILLLEFGELAATGLKAQNDV